MLPITNQRAFHIPHSLATVAAIVATIVALATPLGWDESGNPIADTDVGGSALDQVTSSSSLDADTPADPQKPASTGGADCEPGVLSGLLPLVLPSISGF